MGTFRLTGGFTLTFVSQALLVSHGGDEGMAKVSFQPVWSFLCRSWCSALAFLPGLAFLSGFALAAPFAYIPNTGSNSVSVIDTASNAVTATVAVGSFPIGVAVNPAGTRVYVANQNSNDVSVIDTASNTVTATVGVGASPHGVAVNPAGTRVYVANTSANNVSVIDTASNTVTTSVAVGSGPYGVAVNPAGTRVYVANQVSNNVSVIDTASNTVVATVGVGTTPLGVAVNPAGTRVYLSNFNSGNVSVIDTATNTVTATVAVGSLPVGVAVNPAGTRVYVAVRNANAIAVLDTATNTVTANVAVGTFPYGVAGNPAGTRVYVANLTANNVSVIDTATNTVTATVAVGTGPFSLGKFVGPEPAVVASPPPAAMRLDRTTLGATSESGASTTFWVQLSRSPASDVVIPIVSSNTAEVLSSVDTVTFRANSSSLVQAVTLTGQDDFAVDGDQVVRITVGPLQTSDPEFGAPPVSAAQSFLVSNRDNDVAVPMLPFVGGVSTGFLDVTNVGATTVASLLATMYDCSGAAAGNKLGAVARELAPLATRSLHMADLQQALGVMNVANPACAARLELYPLGGAVFAQGRVKSGVANDAWNSSATSRLGATVLPETGSGDRFRLRITNLDVVARDVAGTVFDEDGAVVGNPGAVLVRQLGPNASIALNVGTVTAALGATWRRRAWLALADNEHFAVQAVVLSAGTSVMAPLLRGAAQASAPYVLPPGDSKGASYVRLYNPTAYVGSYAATLTDTNGTSRSIDLGWILPRAVRVLSAQDVATLFGMTWTGPARLDAYCDMCQVSIVNTLRTGGYLADVTEEIADGIVAHLPDTTDGLEIELVVANAGTQSSTLTGTLTNASGTVVGAADFALGTLKSGSSLTLTRADLQARAGSWTGMATLRLGGATGIRVLALLRNPVTGMVSNLSQRLGR